MKERFFSCLGLVFLIFCAIPSQEANALIIYFDQKGKRTITVKTDGTKKIYPTVTPARNKSHLVPVGQYEFDERLLPPCIRQDPNNPKSKCRKTSFGRVIPFKYGWSDSTKTQKVFKHINGLTQWGAPHKSIALPMFFKPVGSPPIKNTNGFFNAWHSEVFVCNTTGRDLYNQNFIPGTKIPNPVNYFGENPFLGSVRNCHRPPRKIVRRYETHGCGRMGHDDIWEFYTDVQDSYDAGIKPIIEVLP